MENLLTFTGVVMIAFGVLQIILFFKMWMMTNDVRKIKGKLKCSNSSLWEVRRALLKGDSELAKELLMNCLLDDLERYGYSGVGFNSIDEIWKKYDAPFKQLEIEIPERLKQLKSFSDIRDIITFYAYP